MPACARITFSSFPSSSDLQFAVWRRVTERVLGASPTTLRTFSRGDPTSPLASAAAHARPQPHAAPRGIWQLLAANNRELARSTSDYPHFSEALEHIERLRESATQIQVRIDRQPHQRNWFWVADFLGEPVMASARVFGSASAAAKTAAAAALALSTATIDAQPKGKPARAQRAAEPW